MIDHAQHIKALCETIKRLREENDMTQKDLSLNSGLTIDYISKLERGQKNNPKLITLFKLSSGLKISATQLMSELEKKS